MIGAGKAGQNSQVQTFLSTYGYTVTIGDTYSTFSRSSDFLGSYNAVLLMPGFSDDGLDMPTAGQTALLNYVQTGGGLVTTEWSAWLTSRSYLQTLSEAFPVSSVGTYRSTTSTTYFQSTYDSVIDYNLPASSYTFNNLRNSGGTESILTANDGATVFFTSSIASGAVGVAGWTYGSGRVISLSLLAAESDPNYQQLLANSIAWADPPTAVPEPSTLFLLGSALAGLWFWGRKKVKGI